MEKILIDDRYLIYLDTGVIYDIHKAKDIPQEIFELRDIVMRVSGKNEAL